VKPPVARAVDDRFARQLGPVKEEQQHDADVRRHTRDRRPHTARRQQRCQQHGAEQQQDERFDEREDAAHHAPRCMASTTSMVTRVMRPRPDHGSG
jgi:hypothetical protein